MRWRLAAHRLLVSARPEAARKIKLANKKKKPVKRKVSEAYPNLARSGKQSGPSSCLLVGNVSFANNNDRSFLHLRQPDSELDNFTTPPFPHEADIRIAPSHFLPVACFGEKEPRRTMISPQRLVLVAAWLGALVAANPAQRPLAGDDDDDTPLPVVIWHGRFFAGSLRPLAPVGPSNMASSSRSRR